MIKGERVNRIILLVAIVAALCVGWTLADAAHGATIDRAARIANVLPRDGELYRGKVEGCSWQARVFPDGHGYVGVICGNRSTVAMRSTAGKWRGTVSYYP